MSIEPGQIELECKRLISKFRMVILATAGEDGVPDASSVPYLLSDGSFVILVSELAKHTSHLLSTQRCTVLFLEEERETANLFARKRLTIACEVAEIDRNQVQSEQLLDGMAEMFGPTIGMLRQLPDFHLLRLNPQHCSYVRGFGQAFRFLPADHPGVLG